MPELTDKQKAFVQEYLIDLNATQAAIRAGYSKKTAAVVGHENLRKPYIAEAVAEAQAARARRTQIDADYVLETIVDTVERCRQVRPVLDKSGKQVLCKTETGEMVPAFVFDAGNVLKGTEQLGKHLKLFTDKTETDTTLVVNISSEDAKVL